ncbi:S9 family peptidase [Longispora albida]|uniref:S9 family peptidase n=1 Tax=Longispora albida TaxID=203523 RepID=UPI00036C451F|nr:prolyl oligopeptidase family serine peptidase [Longispora albida]
MVDFPGPPRAVRISADGLRVTFLRSGQLRIFDLPEGSERAVVTPGPLSWYSADALATVAAFEIGGELHRADLATGEVTAIDVPGPVSEPRPDPTGRRIAYLTGGSLRVWQPDGHDFLLAGEDSRGVSWGVAEPVASEVFGRDAGYWWSPDGEHILATRVDVSRLPDEGVPLAGQDNAMVSLHVLDLDGGWVDVHWDRLAYPYLAAAEWSHSGPLITVLRRLQQHGLALTIDPRTGETQVHAELSDPHWVEFVPGTPSRLPDGRVVLAGELVRDGLDARCLFADGALLTPPSMYPRSVCGVLPEGLLLGASEGEPSEQHLYLVSLAPSTPPRQLTTTPGWHSAVTGGDTYALCSASWEHGEPQWTVVRGDTRYTLDSGTPLRAARPALTRVTDRQIPVAVCYPAGHVPGVRLPVLVQIGTRPGEQQVRADGGTWAERQWWADQGFAVVSVDGRGTPGCSPRYEKVVHHRIGDVALADQCDALHALAAKHPDLDLDRVGVRGTGYGGFLAIAALLRRPDLFQAGVAHAPLLDWGTASTGFAERYLGLPLEQPEAYARHWLHEELSTLERPLLMSADGELEFLREHLS